MLSLLVLKNISLVPCGRQWIISQQLKRNFVSTSGHVMTYLFYRYQWNTKPFHFNFFPVKGEIYWVAKATVIFSSVTTEKYFLLPRHTKLPHPTDCVTWPTKVHYSLVGRLRLWRIRLLCNHSPFPDHQCNLIAVHINKRKEKKNKNKYTLRVIIKHSDTVFHTGFKWNSTSFVIYTKFAIHLS